MARALQSGHKFSALSLSPQALRLRLASQEAACSLWKRESCRILQPCRCGWGTRSTVIESTRTVFAALTERDFACFTEAGERGVWD